MIGRLMALTASAVIAYYMVASRRAPFRVKYRKLAIVGILLTAFALAAPSGDRDYYEIMRVHPSASPSLIREAKQRILTVLMHKGIGQDEETAVFIKYAADVLSKRETQWEYNHFGDFYSGGTVLKEDNRLFQMTALSVLYSILVHIVGQLLTFPKMFRAARPIIAVYALILFVCELQQRLFGTTINLGMFYLLPFQSIQFCRRLTPVAITLAVCISDWMYDENDDLLRVQLKGLLSVQKALMIQMSQLQKLLSERALTSSPALQRKIRSSVNCLSSPRQATQEVQQDG